VLTITQTLVWYGFQRTATSGLRGHSSFHFSSSNATGGGSGSHRSPAFVFVLLSLATRFVSPGPLASIADDTGLGKTIEAGLIARELLLRKKAKTTLPQ